MFIQILGLGLGKRSNIPGMHLPSNANIIINTEKISRIEPYLGNDWNEVGYQVLMKGGAVYPLRYDDYNRLTHLIKTQKGG